MKRKINTLIVSGFLVVIIPFLGFPESLDKVLLFLGGLLIVFTAFSLKSTGSNSSGRGVPSTHVERMDITKTEMREVSEDNRERSGESSQ